MKLAKNQALQLNEATAAQRRKPLALVVVTTLVLLGCNAQMEETEQVINPGDGRPSPGQVGIRNESATVDAIQPGLAQREIVNPNGRNNSALVDRSRENDLNERTTGSQDTDDVVVSGSFVRTDHSQAQSASVSQTPPAHQVNRLGYQPQILNYGPMTNRENYLPTQDNLVKLVTESPVSTFSIDVDTAGYSNLRRMIVGEGRLPPHDAVRLEEMINYFSYDYQTPQSLEDPLAINTELMASPWNPENRLLMVGVKGFEPDLDERPPANLVFLVDVSGSMQSPDKLGLVKRSLKLLVDQMDEEDRLALVVYAGAAGLVLDSTSASERVKIDNAIDSLAAGGSTNGAAGIQLAYRVAEQNLVDGGINRVIIASDGDLNVGMTDIDQLKELIENKRKHGVALTTLGFGSGNYNYSLMEQLADVGNGNAAYIDSLSEARKVLVDEMQSTLLTIAKDVKIQIEFNPAQVSEYRLIGYENRILNREDFVNDKVDAGEIGAGHTVTALYEISLVGSEGGLVPPSRYGQNNRTLDTTLANELAYVKLRYKRPDEERSVEIASAVVREDSDNELSSSSSDIRFAAAVAGFGQLLRGGQYINDWGYDELIELTRQSRGDDPHGYRSELLNLIETAKLL